MKQIKVGHIVGLIDGPLNKILENDLPFSTVLKFKKLLAELTPAYQIFVDKQRKLFAEYGDGNQITEEPMKQQYVEEINPVLNEEVEVQNIFTEEELTKGLEGIKLNYAELNALDPFIED